jgi:hypothetical protein
VERLVEEKIFSSIFLVQDALGSYYQNIPNRHENSRIKVRKYFFENEDAARTLYTLNDTSPESDKLLDFRIGTQMAMIG